MAENKTINVFIIEDNKMFSLLLKAELQSCFENEDFKISLFESGEECKEELNLNPDIAIVDYHLDSSDKDAMNGLKVIEMIREKCPSTEFILVTADKHTELFLRSMEHNVFDYLIKGTNVPYNLNLSVSRWLNMRNQD